MGEPPHELSYTEAKLTLYLKELIITFRYTYCPYIKLVGRQSKDRAPWWLDKDGWPDETEAQELGLKT